MNIEKQATNRQKKATNRIWLK